VLREHARARFPSARRLFPGAVLAATAGAAGAPTSLAEQATRAAAFSARHSDRLAASTPDQAGAAIVHDHDARDLYIAIQASAPSFYVEAHRGILHPHIPELFARAFERMRPARAAVPLILEHATSSSAKAG
jgi:hypothetical protein